jgi:ATP:ADP antiporter, AAA family
MFSFFAQYGLLFVEFVVAAAAIFLLAATGLIGQGPRKALSGMTRALWGDISDAELKKFGFLAMAFFILIGTYWALRSVKDALFDDLVGLAYQPYAKMSSVVVFSMMILLYGKITDMFQRTKLFFVICSFFSILFAIAGFAYSYPALSPYLHVPFIPGNILGWASYFAIESFGGITIAALFWAFVTSITESASGKKGFPIIVLAGQVGNFLGATFVKEFVQTLGFTVVLYIISAAIMLIPVLIWLTLETTPNEFLLNDARDEGGKKKKKTGAFEGIRLIFSHGYLMGVMVIATVYEVIITIVDFQFKTLARQVYAKEAFASYMANYAQMNSLVSILFVFIGTGFLIRNFGVRLCLLAYPAVAGLAIGLILFKPVLGAFFVAMIAVKAFSYALNNPVKELLYLPTSHDVKFKAKSFIDALGQKSAKATGSAVNASLIGSGGAAGLASLLTYGSLISMGIVGVWIVVAIGLGHRYDKIIKDGEIIK